MATLLNKLSLIAALILIISGCKSLEYKDFSPSKRDFSKKLPRMNIVDSTSGRTLRKFEGKFYEDEIEQWMENKGEYHGTVTVNVADIDDFSYYGFAYLFLAEIPPLFGAPIARTKTVTDVGIRIYDKQDRLLATYSAVAEAKGHAGLYFNYNFTNAEKAADVKAFRKAFNKIRLKVQQDIPEIRDKLNAQN